MSEHIWKLAKSYRVSSTKIKKTQKQENLQYEAQKAYPPRNLQNLVFSLSKSNDFRQSSAKNDFSIIVIFAFLTLTFDLPGTFQVHKCDAVIDDRCATFW